MTQTILIIEDDNDINNLLYQLLTANGYHVKRAFSGTEALLVHDESVNLILMDLMLPGRSGSEILQELQAKSPAPVIVVSAIDYVDKKVELFELGAIDYVTKPFHNAELLARIKAHIGTAPSVTPAKVLHYKDLSLDLTAYTVQCNQQDISLTKKEFELLALFIENPTQTFTKSVLFDKIWGYDQIIDTNTLNSHISKIKSKLKKCNPNEEYIETVWSVGYRLKK